MTIKAKTILAQALDCRVDDILDTSALGTHPNWDSLAHMRLLVLLESDYNFIITDESIEQFKTVSGIHSALSELRG